MLRKKETRMTIDVKTGAILEKMEIITLMKGTRRNNNTHYKKKEIQMTIDAKTGEILEKKVII